MLPGGKKIHDVTRKVCKDLREEPWLSPLARLGSEDHAAIAASSQQSPSSPCTMLSALRIVQLFDHGARYHHASGSLTEPEPRLDDGEELGIPTELLGTEHTKSAIFGLSFPTTSPNSEEAPALSLSTTYV